ncbi:MAG: transcriptional regulator [Streptomyces sp.]|nr:transcriptional regulator [Streptomyces sp.]NUS24405.1 transcriptional regulator [Streptomyces sp.]
MSSSTSNHALKAARQAAGLASQQALADALSKAATQLGLGITVSVRQVRRWESATPPWPQDDYQRLLIHVLHLPLDRLGFRAPWATDAPRQAVPQELAAARPPVLRAALPRPAGTATQPPTIGADYAIVTEAHRRLYPSVAPSVLAQAVIEHAGLGTALLGETDGVARRVLATALAESLLLAGRIQFFDLRQPDQAEGTYLRALQAAGEADDALMGAAILAHHAFIPGWVGRRDEMADLMVAARTYARRGAASAEVLAWLDAVEAECLTRAGDHRAALTLLRRAEDTLAVGTPWSSPDWFTWFSPIRLAAFKGATELAAGHLPQARATLQQVLADLPATDGKQSIVVLADLAAVEAAVGRPAEACAALEEALDQLAATWYAMGMEKVRAARRVLAPWQETEEVRRVDDRLYSWGATLSSMQR